MTVETLQNLLEALVAGIQSLFGIDPSAAVEGEAAGGLAGLWALLSELVRNILNQDI
ncbi:MAG: hypothetical protein LBN05_03575 [Oscillospiraceae bacterium]|jgi:hypothetical protein|nr:hypothetical protein [Oscillospiraceae bacterium]